MHSQHDGGVAPDAKLWTDAGEPGAVDPAHSDALVSQGLADVLEDGLQFLAVAAPRGVELKKRKRNIWKVFECIGNQV